MEEIRIMGWGGWLKFVWKGHLTNWFWRDRQKRRAIRKKYHKEAWIGLTDKYIPFVKSLKTAPNSEHSPVDEKAFSLWFQGEQNAPEIVKKCLQTIRNEFGNNFILIDQGNYSEYVTLPSFIKEKWEIGEICDAHLADLIRLELLKKYGGFWFDATDFMTGNVPQSIAELPFFMYMADEERAVNMFIQNCFIRSERDYPLVTMWLELLYEYWKHEKRAINYFFGQNLFKLLITYNEEAKRLFEKMPKIDMSPTHRLWHKIGNEPYSEDEVIKMKADAFFQKCSHKRLKRGLHGIRKGSIADCVINGRF